MAAYDPRSARQLDKFWFMLADAVAQAEVEHGRIIEFTLGTRKAVVTYNRDTESVVIGVSEIEPTPPTLIAPPAD